MHDLEKRENQGAGNARPEELRQLAAALRARLHFHRQCNISAYPFIAAPQVLAEAAIPKKISTASKPRGQSPKTEQPRRQAQVARNLQQVHAAVRACSRCPMGLHLAADSSRRVVGAGQPGAAFMVVGDYALEQGAKRHDAEAAAVADAGPALCFGTDADILFWKMMQSIQLRPQDVYVTNALKCSPGEEKEPDMAWLQQCRLHLLDEINTVQPQLICAMGDIAALVLLGAREPVARLRGRIHSLKAGGRDMVHYRVVVSYHPRFLLRVEDMKRAAWDDLQRMRDLLRQGPKTRLKR